VILPQRQLPWYISDLRTVLAAAATSTQAAC
jgi:hypothetical protein